MTLPVQPAANSSQWGKKGFLFTYSFRYPAHFLLYQKLIFLFPE